MSKPEPAVEANFKLSHKGWAALLSTIAGLALLAWGLSRRAPDEQGQRTVSADPATDSRPR